MKRERNGIICPHNSMKFIGVDDKIYFHTMPQRKEMGNDNIRMTYDRHKMSRKGEITDHTPYKNVPAGLASVAEDEYHLKIALDHNSINSYKF
jgi:hypothetical protein